MKTITFSNYSFKKLEKMKLDSSIINTEAKLFIIPEKLKWNTFPKVLKIFYNDEGNIFSNKLFTINSLIDKKDKIGIDELIFPEKIAIVGAKVCGYTMPYIENINLDLLLKNPNVSNNEKIKYLKQIGEILEKMKVVRKNTDIKDFYLNDINENNFIINLSTGKLNCIDLDSCKINNNKPFASRYLTPLSPIGELPKKYIKNRDNKYPGFIVANENSDLFCYSIIVLNYLFQGKVKNLNIEQFYIYLNYLRKIGLPYKLIDKFDLLYQHRPNKNITEDLDYITQSVLEKSNAVAFYNKVLNKKIY